MFLYIAGCIGWSGREYLKATRGTKGSTEGNPNRFPAGTEVLDRFSHLALGSSA